MSSRNKSQGIIRVSHREIVGPGDVIGEGGISFEKYPYAYRFRNKIISTVLGVAEVRSDNTLKITPLEGVYIPSEGDIVIGVVEEVNPTYAYLDIRAPYKGILPATEILGRPLNPSKDVLTDYVSIGDVFLARVERFDLLRDPLLSIRKEKGLGRIVEGSLIEIIPTRVPRVIGRRSSMLEILTKETGCDVVIANNGRILIRRCATQEHEEILIKALKIIEMQPYVKGLTNKIREYIVVEKVRRGLIGGYSQGGSQTDK
ncbi:MAG: exosome complex RNA-binding protein Rrp4 [Sulfolobales archaeon]